MVAGPASGRATAGSVLQCSGGSALRVPGENRLKAFLAELRRRNVVRAALLYVGAVWALAQGVAQLAPELGMPGWSTRAFVVAGAIGFPLWLLFAWFYEFTPEGFKRESNIPEGQSITRQTGRKLDFWIIGVLAVALVLLLTDRFVSTDAPASDAMATAELARSIAVLPLANVGRDAQDDYFSDGLSEELISSLARISALRVIGRSSAFTFKGSDAPRAEIAARLGVAHLLEGTVRRDGDRIRILVELIRPADGTSLWSQTYSREMKDIFAVQADIARAVAAALQVQFGADAQAVDYTQPPNGNLAAYDAALQGRSVARQQTVQGYERSVELLRRAIRLEPDYAFAHAILANVLVNLAGARGDMSDPALQAEARASSEAAMRLAPDYYVSHTTHGYILQYFDGDMEAAGAAFRRGRELAPNEGAPAMFLSGYLQQTGQYDEAIALLGEAVASDPLRVDWRMQMVDMLLATGRFDEALDATRRVLEIAPDNARALYYMAYELRSGGRYGEAVEHARRAIAAAPKDMFAYGELAYALEGDNRLDEAFADLREALAAAPDHPTLHSALGDLLLKHGHYEESLAHLQRAVEANPTMPYYRISQGYALSNLGRLDEAERSIRDGLAINPQEPFLNGTLADILALRGDAKAVRAAAEAETKPDIRRYAQAVAAAVERDPPGLAAAIDTLVDTCGTRKHSCATWAASVHAFARQPEQMFAILGQLEQDPAYRPDLGDPFYQPYFTDPRYLRHLDKYGMSPPSPVSRAPRAH